MEKRKQCYLHRNFPILILAVLTVLPSAAVCTAQYAPITNQEPQPYSAGYSNGYGYSNHNPQPSTLYTANREVLPQGNAGTVVQAIPAASGSTGISESKPEEQKPPNVFTKMYGYWFKGNSKNKDAAGTAVVKPSQSSSPAPDARVSAQNNKEPEITGSEKKPWYMFWKKDNEKTDGKTENLPDTSVDKGQEEVALLEQERSFSEKDYVDSAVKSSKTAAKNDYSQGLQLEGLGDYDGAARCYNNFIKANKKQTANGTLAAPYHRLALLAWKQKEWDKADVYFRHGQRYAQGGNIAVISGDYSLFLMEQGKLEQSEIILRNTLLYFPKDQRLLICLGRCSARQDKPVEALRYMTSVMSEEQAYHELAGLYHQIGDYKSARIMNEKRDELFAAKSAASIYGSSQAANSAPQNSAGRNSAQQYAVNNQQMPLPVNRPPVTNSAANSTTSAIPFPVFNPTLPQTAASPYQLPQNINSEPEARAVPVLPDVQQSGNTSPPPQSAVDQTITKVYHYPANSPSPVYHQYAGNSYPQMAPVQVQSANNPKDVRDYWASTVPASSNSVEAVPADPFAVQQPVMQQPMPMVAEQRGGYPPAFSHPQNNVQ
ncbi:hypothetical protein FACS189427_10560 [Planctomycetales bacterium]|nr:hypothetical protein FACS189427_10560 [Planctomycetales bacterium]